MSDQEKDCMMTDFLKVMLTGNVLEVWFASAKEQNLVCL